MSRRSSTRCVVLLVLDTNVVVSALLFDGPAFSVHRAWIEGRVELIFTREILDEYRRVLSYLKFGLSEEDAAYLIEEEILPFGCTISTPEASTLWIPEDSADDRFIEAAVAGNAAALVSGDTHILSRRIKLPCKVMTLSELTAIIENP